MVNLLSPNLKSGDLVVLKTTLPIGATEEIASLLAKNSGLSLDEELFVAFSPERIVEGKAMEELRSLPKIVGGIGPNSADRACEAMGILGGRVIRVSDSRTAEMCKLMDNAYRMTRFGFSSDIALVSSINGIDAFEAIEAANLDYHGIASLSLLSGFRAIVCPRIRITSKHPEVTFGQIGVFKYLDNCKKSCRLSIGCRYRGIKGGIGRNWRFSYCHWRGFLQRKCRRRQKFTWT